MNQKGFVNIALIVLVIIGIGLFGAIIIYLYQQKPETLQPIINQPEISTETFLYNNHRLIVASQNGLVNLVYNPSTQKYEKRADLALSGLTKVVRLDNYIFAITRSELLKLDSNFKKLNSKKFENMEEFGRIGTIAVNNKNVFLSAEGYFIAFDENLKELSRVELEFNGWRKDAHDILIHKNTAYLLDNVVSPLFILRVDIRDPKNIQITEKIKFESINAHLDNQWINPELNQWLVIESYGTQVGSGQIVHIYSLDKGKEEIATQGIPGFYIKGITNLPPVWAITRATDGKYQLALVKSENYKISFSDFFVLENFDAYLENQDAYLVYPDAYIYGDIIIKQKGNYLFIAPVPGSVVKIINIEGQPKAVVFRDLKEYNVREIIDILPY